MSREDGVRRYFEILAEYSPTHILGVDEVGVGAWAGPVYVSGVLVPVAFSLPGLRDSKKVPEKVRPQLCHDILEYPELRYDIAYCSARMVDMRGLASAVALLMSSVIGLLAEQLDQERCLVVVDGDKAPLGCRQSRNSRIVALPKADDIVPAVMAAANIAKQHRDDRMREIEASDPERYGLFDFAKSKGYGTAQHALALRQRAPTDQHRLSYRPVLRALTYRRTDGTINRSD